MPRHHARLIAVALAVVLAACQMIFDDPCGIGSTIEGEPTPRAECVE